LDLVMYMMIFGLIGSRIFHVFTDFNYYFQNPLLIFAIWQGGLAFQGGLIGGLAALYFYYKKYKIDAMKVLDIIALPLPLLVTFGRVANFINSEHIGYPSNVSWCVVYEKVDNICRQPAEIYEAISMLLLFLIMLFLYSKWKNKKGAMFWSFMAGYGIARFITDFFREQTIFFFGITHTQILSLMMLILGIYYLIRINRPHKRKS
jgi:phosphatidylglycerol---prolipoprotein diacylglyceryl transferase